MTIEDSIFLLILPRTSEHCTRLSEVMNISHDNVNRFLLRERYEHQDLFNEARKLLNMEGALNGGHTDIRIAIY